MGQIRERIENCGTFVERLWNVCGTFVERLWNVCGTFVERLWKFVPFTVLTLQHHQLTPTQYTDNLRVIKRRL
jgi:hypothetical protein